MRAPVRSPHPVGFLQCVDRIGDVERLLNISASSLSD